MTKSEIILYKNKNSNIQMIQITPKTIHTCENYSKVSMFTHGPSWVRNRNATFAKVGRDD